MLVSWKAGRNFRAYHVAESLGAPRTRCGIEIPNQRPAPRVALARTWAPVPARRPADVCAKCWEPQSGLQTDPAVELRHLLAEPPRENAANALQIVRSIAPASADEAIALRQVELRLRALLEQLDGPRG